VHTQRRGDGEQQEQEEPEEPDEGSRGEGAPEHSAQTGEGEDPHAHEDREARPENEEDEEDEEDEEEARFAVEYDVVDDGGYDTHQPTMLYPLVGISSSVELMREDPHRFRKLKGGSKLDRVRSMCFSWFWRNKFAILCTLLLVVLFSVGISVTIELSPVGCGLAWLLFVVGWRVTAGWLVATELLV
jgi:hypothetical protein